MSDARTNVGLQTFASAVDFLLAASEEYPRETGEINRLISRTARTLAKGGETLGAYTAGLALLGSLVILLSKDGCRIIIIENPTGKPVA